LRRREAVLISCGLKVRVKDALRKRYRR